MSKMPAMLAISAQCRRARPASQWLRVSLGSSGPGPVDRLCWAIGRGTGSGRKKKQGRRRGWARCTALAKMMGAQRWLSDCTLDNIEPISSRFPWTSQAGSR